MPNEEPFLRRKQLCGFVGRGDESQQLRNFLQAEHLFLVVHGAGGVGKTRFIVEASALIAEEGEWQVLWANVATMTASATWFDGIVPERPTLLLLDEPDDTQLLKILIEQLSGRVGRASKWKVAVSVRSPKDPVLKFLESSRISPRVQKLEILPLPEQDAESMCKDLLNDGAFANMSDEQRGDAARVIAKRVSRFPVWLTLAVHVLETRRNLSDIPATGQDLADLYLTEITERQKDVPAAEVLQLLRWVALLGTIDRTNDTTVQLIGNGANIDSVAEVRQRLTKLVERRALLERGAKKRLVEVKPDVLRDHILLKWLSLDTGYGDHPIVPSPAASDLVSRVCSEINEDNYSALGRADLNVTGKNTAALEAR